MALVRAASRSVAALALFPMQDVLSLGSEHRMNLPGTDRGNWSWRFTWAQVPTDLAPTLASTAAATGRAAFAGLRTV
jgi:4-alpha-glucanotransferase